LKKVLNCREFDGIKVGDHEFTGIKLREMIINPMSEIKNWGGE
jgi:hypothetical protein